MQGRRRRKDDDEPMCHGFFLKRGGCLPVLSDFEAIVMDTSYGLAGIPELLHTTLGASDLAFKAAPLASMLFAATDVLRGLQEFTKGNYAKGLIRACTSGNLLIADPSLPTGSAAFPALLPALAIKAAGDWVASLFYFIEALQRQRQANSRSSYSSSTAQGNLSLPLKHGAVYAEELRQAGHRLAADTFNLLGWGLLAFGHHAASVAVAGSTLAAGAPVLLAIGSACLIAAGMYKVYNLYNNVSPRYQEQASWQQYNKPYHHVTVTGTSSVYGDGNRQLVNQESSEEDNDTNRPDDARGGNRRYNYGNGGGENTEFR